ncbi:hypothetical protein HDV03_002623 [Kappamyces sp. JEL0829]|nr:hypothetical protein HDV03_002623 [Kappamyces sp. JEL0829]
MARIDPSPIAPLAATPLGLSSETLQIPDESLGVTVVRTTAAMDSGLALHEWKDLEKDVETRRYCCGFFTSRKACLRTCLPIWAAVVVAISLLVFFLFPRVPTITVGMPYVANARSSLKYNTTSEGAVTALSYDIAVNFTVTSKNYYTYYASRIITTGHLLDSNGNAIKNALGFGQLDGSHFPAMAAVTYTMPLTVYWVSVGKGPNDDPALVTLQRCTVKSPPDTLRFVYSTRVELPLFSWTGYKLNPAGEFSFNIATMTDSQRSQIQTVALSVLAAFTGKPVPPVNPGLSF